MDIEKVISELTIQEKLSLLYGKNSWETYSFEDKGVKSIFLSDGPHGIRKVVEQKDSAELGESIVATCYPTASSLASTFNEELIYLMGVNLGEEAKKDGVNIVLGPGVNIKRDPRCGRNFEYFSEDPYLSGKIASSLIKGIQSNGVGACVKHFACNSKEDYRMVNSCYVDERALREIYLTSFEMAVKDAKVSSVMTSYNKLNGFYTSENEHLLQDILRKEWKFDGLVMTDWGGGNNRVKGVKASNDLEMPSSYKETYYDLLKAYKANKLSIEEIDSSVRHILNTVSRVSYDKKDEKINFEEKHEIAKKVSDQSIILLKNEGVLPLKKEDRVLVIGDFARKSRYQGAGSSFVNAYKVDTFLGLEDIYDFEYIGFEQGYKRFYDEDDNKLVSQALQSAKKANKILFFIGLDERIEAEGKDRENLKIRSNQLRLLKRLREENKDKKIIGILNAGSVVDLSFDEDLDALVYCLLQGQAGMRSLLDILEGKISPSGKLAETFIKKLEDSPTYETFNKNRRISKYLESIYVGYRYYEKNDIEVKYPFGYGLSYSKFEYSSLQVNRNGVSLTLKNVGDYDAYETVELFIGKKDSAFFRPIKELKGFKKVYLEKGQEKEVFIPFDEYSFRVFSKDSSKFEVEEGEYQIYIGSSLLDIRLVGKITREGTKKNFKNQERTFPSYFKGAIDEKEFDSLLGFEIEEKEVRFDKKTRIDIDELNTIDELLYSKGFLGRVIGRVFRIYSHHLDKSKDEKKMTYGLFIRSLPLRNISRMTTALNKAQVNGIILMANKHPIKGLKKLVFGK